MKKVFTFTILSLALLLILSCSKNKDQVRINNSFSNDLHVVVGPVDYGQVKTAMETDYRSIPKGTQAISGDITGSIVIPSSGKHKYTININTVGIVTLIDDGN